MRPLVECVPNFSEGRRSEVVEAIVQSIRSGGAVHVLDVSSDYDHNRSVVTVVGTPEELESAIFAGIRTAASLIDMDDQKGEHPRFGASDVIPFIPIRDVKMDDCVEMAKRLGQRIGDELSIPVYLYEAAAARPDRENLANIRNTRFQYEQLKEVIQTNADYMPDYGPAQVGKAGASIVGARPPLIAYNVYLTTSNVEIAKKIASAVRHSSGGLAFVKGAGFLVDGKAQVSMNLTDYHKTPIFRVVEMIRREAQRYGVAIESSELIGLAPQQAFIDCAQWYLQLDRFNENQLLETQIAKSETAKSKLAQEEPPIPVDATSHMAATQIDESLRPATFPAKVAAATATPGGGCVAALAGALGAALTEMVAGLTIGKKNYADVEAEMQTILNASNKLREELLDHVVKDATAFDHLMAAFRMPKDHVDRSQTIQEKTLEAAEIPQHVCRLGLEVLQLAEKAVSVGNKNAATDGAVGANMALAAIESAALNVRINLKSLEDQGRADTMRQELAQILTEARLLRDRILEIAEKRA